MMSPRYATEADGLLDSSGAGIVELLQERCGLDAVNHGLVSFDQVADWAGHQPLAIGGRNWGGPNLGHWSAVRGVNAAGELVLANPAQGPAFGQLTLDRDEFAVRGSFSAVRIHR